MVWLLKLLIYQFRYWKCIWTQGKQSSDEEELDDIPVDDQYDTEDSFIHDAELVGLLIFFVYYFLIYLNILCCFFLDINFFWKISDSWVFNYHFFLIAPCNINVTFIRNFVIPQCLFGAWIFLIHHHLHHPMLFPLKRCVL